MSVGDERTIPEFPVPLYMISPTWTKRRASPVSPFNVHLRKFRDEGRYDGSE